jgi:hypothetical protein
MLYVDAIREFTAILIDGLQSNSRELVQLPLRETAFVKAVLQ